MLKAHLRAKASLNEHAPHPNPHKSPNSAIDGDLAGANHPHSPMAGTHEAAHQAESRSSTLMSWFHDLLHPDHASVVYEDDAFQSPDSETTSLRCKLAKWIRELVTLQWIPPYLRSVVLILAGIALCSFLVALRNKAWRKRLFSSMLPMQRAPWCVRLACVPWYLLCLCLGRLCASTPPYARHKKEALSPTVVSNAPPTSPATLFRSPRSHSNSSFARATSFERLYREKRPHSQVDYVPIALERV